jgi:putative two-component system response regulator
VGKIGVADAILRKSGPLNEGEWREMRGHLELGYKMLKDIDFLQDALPIVRHHHERWDGTGYPDSLAGEDIPLSARLFAIIDSFDAITSDRPYSPARTYEQAVAILREETGKNSTRTSSKLFYECPRKSGAASDANRAVEANPAKRGLGG